jgi:hypothetical protein
MTVQVMRVAIEYIKMQILPPVSFAVFLAVECGVLYGLFRAIVR